MNKFYFILIALFMASGAKAQWFPQNSGTTEHLNAVYFPSPNTGYAVGRNGCILKTINAGINWTELVSPTTEYLISTFFINVDTGYILSSAGEIHRTIDGGANWTDVYDIDCHPPDMSSWCHFQSLFFTSDLTGFFIGSSHVHITFYTYDGGYVYKTTDGGGDWSINTFDDIYIYSLSFPDDSTGYAGGYNIDCDSGTILKTTDGGVNWSVQNFGPFGFGSIYFISADTGYALRGNSIIKTTDGGSNWIVQYLNPPYGFKSVYFTDENNGFVIGGWGVIQNTTDGGENWTTQNSSTYSDLNSIYFTDTDTGYIVGDYGYIGKTTNGGLPVGTSDKRLNCYSLNISPNPASTTITISTPTTPDKNTFLTTFNLNGQQLIQRQLTEQQTVVDVSGLSQGVYFMRVADDRTVMVGKFVKR